MAYIETEDTQNYGLTDKVTEILKKYKCLFRLPNI